LGFYSASSRKQQSALRHIAAHGDIILILSQTVFALTLQRCMFSGEATTTIYKVFGVTDREDGTHDLRALDVSTLTISPTTQFYDGYENS
jgi:hypothetical protein